MSALAKPVLKRPMKGADADLTKLRFPLFASPKLDGLRMLVSKGVALSASLKPLPNAHLQAWVKKHRGILEGLDGEVIVGRADAKDSYRKSMSGIMKREGQPDFFFHVFDHWPDARPFTERHATAIQRVEQLARSLMVSRAGIVQHRLAVTMWDLLAMEERFLRQGFEGVMLRDPEGPYKMGRSSVREGYLLKLKRFQDSEAEVQDCHEMLHNDNAPTKDARGLTKRTSHKEGKRMSGVLGSMTVVDTKTGVEFDVGAGFDASERADLWENRRNVVGRVIKYKFLAVGVKDKPRHPVFLGFRDRKDMGR